MRGGPVDHLWGRRSARKFTAAFFSSHPGCGLAHIVRSAISPSWNDIGHLAAIAAIRTFLSYFLERDLATESKL
jgi:hypothetical protein